MLIIQHLYAENLQSHVVCNSFFANSMLIVTQPLKENEVPGELYYHYFSCNTCKTKTSILNDTVLSNSNRKLCEFVILVVHTTRCHLNREKKRAEIKLLKKSMNM